MTRDPENPRDGTDGYEAEYMPGGGGEILLRDRTVWRWGMPMLGIPALISLGGAAVLFAGIDPSAASAFGLIPLVTAGILGACALLLTVLRVVVSTREVHIQYGTWGPRIPIESITEVKVIDYDWKRYGGWGIRVGLDGSKAYSIMSKAGRRAVQIQWRDGSNVETTVVTSEQPDAVVAAIEEARARASSQSDTAPRVRVEATANANPATAETEPVELAPNREQAAKSKAR